MSRTEAMMAKYARYIELRESGETPASAALDIGVAYSTQCAYENAYRRAHGIPIGRPRPWVGYSAPGRPS